MQEEVGTADEALAKMTELTDKMCACRDMRCATTVQEEMTRWAQEMMKDAGDEKPERLSEEDTKRYSDLTTRLATCAQKAMGAESEPPDASVAAVDAPPPVEKVTNADRLIKQTFDAFGDHAVKKLVLSYVRADATIDDEYGEAKADLGKPRPTEPGDDPKRPVGAPVRKPPKPAYDETARCPSYTWTKGVRAVGDTECAMAGPGLRRPTSSIVEVWKRAIDRGAPKEGLAVIELRGGVAQIWSFAIDDEPRNIHVAIEITDGCAPTLENPQ